MVDAMSDDFFNAFVNDALKKEMDDILSVSDIFEKKDVKHSIIRKSSKKSDEVRKACNQLFVGKHSRGQEDHTKILALYSKSVALAPKDSEELALAYSNRSALLKHLNLPEKSLIDIHRALEITKLDNLKLKLLTRKTNCLKINDDQDLKPSDKIGIDKQYLLVTAPQQKLKFPVFTPSQKIPCAAESVTIAYNESIGRHLIATRDIKPGEVIIAEEGYAVFPKITKMYLFCSHCLTFAWNGIPCDNCALALYCSEECKKKALEEYHDVECFILPFLLSKPFEFVDVDVIAMTARFFIRAVKSEGLHNVLTDSRLIDDKDGLHMEGLLSNKIYDNKKFKFCYNLLTHAEHTKQKIPAQEFYSCLLMNLLLKHTRLLDEYKIISDGDLRITNPTEVLEIKITLAKITNILAVNIHTFQGSLCDCNYLANCNDTCTGKRGQIFASCASLINHSCHPNISRMFMPQRKVVVFATCPVKKGEQLCDTYGPTVRYKNKIQRQQYLQNNYNFTCRCQACRENWSIELNKSDLICFKKLNPKWYKNRYLKADSVQDWTYNEKTMQDVVKASELAYNSFNQNKAYALSIPCRDYIEHAFYKFYEDDCRVPDKC